MNQSSDQPQPEAAGPASNADDPATTSPVETQSTAPAGAQPPRKAAAIRIGTQRYGVKPPSAVPTPVLPAPPAELLAKAAALSAEASKPAASAPTGATTTEQPPASSAPSAPPVAPRKHDGGQKPASKKPRTFETSEPPRSGKLAPPNIRAQLTPDLEQELAEALGDQPLDEMIAGGAAGEAVTEIEPESRQKGRVISVHRDNVFVEINGRQQGVVPLKNFAAPPEPGAVLDLMVSRFNAAEGLYELVLPGSTVDVGDWSEVAEGMVVEAVVTGHNKGGLECEVNRLRGFIPASQISIYRVEDLAQFVGQKFACVIAEANPEKRNLVLSRRAMLEREKAEAKEKLMAELEVGQTREAIVRSLQNFGAFVDLGGVDGLIHISQLSWDRIKHASEVLEIGQKVKVKVQKIDPQTGKISLAFRDLSENPWSNVARDFPSRSRVPGTVSRLMEFGAFVRLAPGVEGLIHISELSHKRVFRVSDVLSEGQEVEVQVLSVDPEQQRISLSLKALEARAAPVQKAEEDEPEEAPKPEPKKRKTPLKGGIGDRSGGAQFGLKW